MWHPGGMDGVAADDAVADLYEELGAQCLPAPPIPAGLRASIRKLGDDQWGTEPFDAQEQYLHDGLVERLQSEPMSDPLWCFGYHGHGANSYAYSLTCRTGPLVLAFQGLWVKWELYNSPGSDAAELARLFQVARSLLATVEGRTGPVQVIADASLIRGGYSVIPIGTPTGSTSEDGQNAAERRIGCNSPDDLKRMVIGLLDTSEK